MRPLIARAPVVALAGLVFAFSWLLRFNDPGGSFAGLTDDHFFYVVRGWQILFGDLPVRDFVDHGAPLYYYLAAGVQLVFGRGTASELAFSVTMLSLGATAVFLLAWRASGWLVLGLAGALLHILLEPRFYNYPKILVYAAAIPALWWFADRPGRRPVAVLAVITAVAFLLRHDHGIFVAVAMAAMLAVLGDVPLRERVRHGVAYAGLTALLVAPYLLFIAFSGGLGRYFRDASDWAAKDRSRAPVVWPGLFDNPEGLSEAARSAEGLAWVTAVMRDNMVAWLYYVELILPFAALGLLALSRDAFRPGWPRAWPKLATVAVLALVLNAGFLRSPLAARLADPSVPHAILVAWMAAAAIELLRRRESLRPALKAHAAIVRAAVVAAIVPLAAILGVAMSHDFYRRLDKAALTERPGKAFERAGLVRRQLRDDWRLVSWAAREDRPDLLNLSLYLNACTRPDDRIFVQPYIPAVLAMARRGFAGGHADLRPGFFKSPEAQALTVERLQRQSVPVALLEMDDEYRNFRRAFPLVATHFDTHYELAGQRVFDNRFGVQLFVRRDRPRTRRYDPLGWPCFQ